MFTQPFNTHFKPGKGILAVSVKCSVLGPAWLPTLDAPLRLCHSQAEQKDDPEHLRLAFMPSLIQRLRRTPALWSVTEQLSSCWRNGKCQVRGSPCSDPGLLHPPNPSHSFWDGEPCVLDLDSSAVYMWKDALMQVTLWGKMCQWSLAQWLGHSTPRRVFKSQI